MLRGKHNEAEHECREVLAATLPVLGPDHTEALQTRHQVARLPARQGQHRTLMSGSPLRISFVDGQLSLVFLVEQARVGVSGPVRVAFFARVAQLVGPPVLFLADALG